MANNLRNIAIIAHVDHGKTTLVDKLLSQSQTFDDRFKATDRMMDSNDLEKERGITISSKIQLLNGVIIELILLIPQATLTLVGEVERVLSMVDSVIAFS